MSTDQFDEKKLKKREMSVGKAFNKKVIPGRKKPLLKRHWFWVLLLLIVAVIVILLFAGNCNGKVKEQNPVPTSVQPKESEPNIIDTPAASDTTTVIAAAVPFTEEKPSFNKEQSESPKTADIDVLLMAKQVIRGDYGNGNERKKALKDNYQVIQDQVNLNYRNGDLYW